MDLRMVALAVTLGSASCGSGVPEPTAAPRPVDTTAACVASPAIAPSDLDDLFGVTSVEPAAGTGAEAYRQRVRQLLQQAPFYEILTPKLFQLYAVGDVLLVNDLSVGKTESGKEFYYLVEPCDEAKLERARPWWNPTSEVLICADDHRPDRVTSRDDQYSCDMHIFPIPITHASGCGCGPDLIFCAPMDVAGALMDASMEEIRLTVQHVVQEDRPMSELFTMNATVRSGAGDYFYAANAFFQTGKFDPPDLKAPPALRPRAPPFQGGLLTTPMFLFAESRRELIAQLWQDAMCSPFRSSRVDPHVLLDAGRGAPALRKEHLTLASTPGCQNCHARLEYGGRAFAGWQNAWFGQHYEKTLAAGITETRFYVRDHTDLRAEGPATPAWLGQTIVDQPEFAQCMVEKVSDFVYEGHDVPPGVRRQLLQSFRASPRLGRLLEDAVVARALGEEALTGARASATCREASR